MCNVRMRLLLAPLVVVLLAGIPLFAQAPAQNNPPPPKQRETFFRKVLRISGISASPATLKGPGDEVVSGEVWLVNLGSGKKQDLTPDARYRSPVFVPGSENILALRGKDIVQISPSGGAPKTLHSIEGIEKLVGFSQDDADQVLILLTIKTGTWTVGMLSRSTGKLDTLPYDSGSTEDRQMLEHLRNWDRTYGDKTVYVKRQSKQSLSGPVEWSDVFLKQGSNPPVNISACDEVNCGQPSLSSNAKFLVFVKSQP